MPLNIVEAKKKQISSLKIIQLLDTFKLHFPCPVMLKKLLFFIHACVITLP